MQVMAVTRGSPWTMRRACPACGRDPWSSAGRDAARRQAYGTGGTARRGGRFNAAARAIGGRIGAVSAAGTAVRAAIRAGNGAKVTLRRTLARGRGARRVHAVPIPPRRGWRGSRTCRTGRGPPRRATPGAEQGRAQPRPGGLRQHRRRQVDAQRHPLEGVGGALRPDAAPGRRRARSPSATRSGRTRRSHFAGSVAAGAAGEVTLRSRRAVPAG